MDHGENPVSIELQEYAEPVPQLLKLISSNEVAGFDSIMVSYIFWYMPSLTLVSFDDSMFEIHCYVWVAGR